MRHKQNRQAQQHRTASTDNKSGQHERRSQNARNKPPAACKRTMNVQQILQDPVCVIQDFENTAITMNAWRRRKPTLPIYSKLEIKY